MVLLQQHSKISLEELQPAIDLVKSWGLEPVIPELLFSEENQLAGPDITRTQVFQQLLDDLSVHAIWCVRGGYGTVRIVDHIDWSSWKQHPKWIIGYSDITVFHGHLLPHDIATLHATMPINIAGNTPDTLISLKAALFGEPLQYALPSHAYNRPGNARGKLVAETSQCYIVSWVRYPTLILMAAYFSWKTWMNTCTILTV